MLCILPLGAVWGLDLWVTQESVIINAFHISLGIIQGLCSQFKDRYTKLGSEVWAGQYMGVVLICTLSITCTCIMQQYIVGHYWTACTCVQNTLSKAHHCVQVHKTHTMLSPNVHYGTRYTNNNMLGSCAFTLHTQHCAQVYVLPANYTFYPPPPIGLVSTLNSFDYVWLHCQLHLNTPLHSYDHQHILTITINKQFEAWCYC